MSLEHDGDEEKEEVLRRLRVLEAQVGAVRSPTLAEGERYEEAKQQVQQRLEYLQSIVEGNRRWR